MKFTATGQCKFIGRYVAGLMIAVLAVAGPFAHGQAESPPNERSAALSPNDSNEPIVRVFPPNAIDAKNAVAGAAAPARKTIVALDIGHTPEAPGCISAYGRTEYSYNKEIVERIAARLTQSEQVKPYVVNPDGHAISLRLRTEMARKHGAALFLSIHHDAAQPKYLKSWMVDGRPQFYSEDFRGYGVFVSQKNLFPVASKSFGTLLGQEMRRAGFQFSPHHNEPVKGENRPILDEESGLYRYDDLIVLKTARMPAVLLECGVIIHPEEARILAQSDTQEKIARAVALAVERIVADRAQTPWR
jgi:N-acetylmuramoyl-L-alanine amidase